MVEPGRWRGIGRLNIDFGGFTLVAQNASERAQRTKVETDRDSRATSLASRCGFCFHDPNPS
jgi:hypothetical protein